MTRKLHIGGQVRTPGWEVLDVNPGPCVDHVCNASDLRAFANESVEQIYASHVLEHFDYRDQLVPTLKEWHRVLVPGGCLFVSVPDLDILARLVTDMLDEWCTGRVLESEPAIAFPRGCSRGNVTGRFLP